MKPLLIRADGDSRMGTGHLMRCLALAQAWQDSGGRAAFAVAAAPPPIHARLIDEGCEVTELQAIPGSAADAASLIALAQLSGAEWVVVDGYQFDAAYQQMLCEAGLHVLFIDDYGHAEWYCASLVLNQNGYANAETYARRDTATRLLLGTRYALLRREFRQAHLADAGDITPLNIAPASQRRPAAVQGGDQGKKLDAAPHVLVTLGGADPHNLTEFVLRALAQLPVFTGTIVIGGGNPRRAKLEALAQTMPHVRLVWNVADMPALMQTADIAISAAGSTCWELACMGVPMMVIALADNQRPIAAYLAENGIGMNLGWHSDVTSAALTSALTILLADTQRRSAMAQRGRALVDGAGALRVAEAMDAPAAILRRAVAADAQMIWEWANDPVTRAMSFTSDPIPWERHVSWFQERIARTDSLFLIATNGAGEPIGQVRFDSDGETAVISVAVAPAYRGRGYGASLIRGGVTAVFAEQGCTRVEAYIKPENLASLRAFRAAGFQDAGQAMIRGGMAVRLALIRNKVQQ